MLITNKQSNILEDLETLKLLSKVVRLMSCALCAFCSLRAAAPASSSLASPRPRLIPVLSPVFLNQSCLHSASTLRVLEPHCCRFPNIARRWKRMS